MYFDFEDSRPDITPVGRAISWREGVLLSIIVHLLMLIVALLAPRLFPYDAEAVRARAAAVERERQQQRERPPRFVFVQPRVDPPAPKPPDRAEASDKDRQARAERRAKEPTNRLPLSRGNSPEKVEPLESDVARGQGPAEEPAADLQARAQPPPPDPPKLPESGSGLQFPTNPLPEAQAGRSRLSGGSLGDALRNLQRYVQRYQFQNPQGGGGAFGPAIQFDTKGVEFGPWIRRFVAQVYSNWLIPYAAMTARGHVVITFNVHRDGRITDLNVIGPSAIGAFNTAAYGALASSNPTVPLPPEYPDERAFFTVTFFYNEEPQ